MTNRLIIRITMFIIYYNIGGLATTNILRLTRGNKLNILSSVCVCENCNSKIPAYLQLPIISYVICRGHCKNCGCKIPVSPLALEIVIISGMYLLTTAFDYSFLAIMLSFAFYEFVRIFVIMIRGKREQEFIKQYIIAIISMIPYVLVSLFFSVLYSMV